MLNQTEDETQMNTILNSTKFTAMDKTQMSMEPTQGGLGVTQVHLEEMEDDQLTSLRKSR